MSGVTHLLQVDLASTIQLTAEDCSTMHISNRPAAQMGYLFYSALFILPFFFNLSLQSSTYTPIKMSLPTIVLVPGAWHSPALHCPHGQPQGSKI
jgi:hypothetical protein